MFLPGGTLLNPPAQQRHLTFRERLTRGFPPFTPRHSDGWIRRRDTLYEQALVRIAGRDRESTAPKLALGTLFQIEPQGRELRSRSVALKALVGKDRADVPVELNGRGQRPLGGRGRRPLRRRLRDLTQERGQHQDERTHAPWSS